MIRLFEEKSHVETYIKHRPTWPPHVAIRVLDHLKTKKHSPPKEKICDHLIDVGCGSGQSTPMYAHYCRKITALDPSPEQIKMASLNNKRENIEYIVAEAENMPLPDNSADLICCAHSIHWLDWEPFFKECKRVLVPDGCMAIYTTDSPMPKIQLQNQEAADRCNTLFDNFHKKCRYHSKHKHIKNRLSDFYELLPCSEKIRDDSMKMTKDWRLAQLQGYISSLSGYRTLVEETKADPLPQLMAELKEVIGKDAENENWTVTLTWSIFMILSDRPI